MARVLYNSGFGKKARAVITRMFIAQNKVPPNLPIPRPAQRVVDGNGAVSYRPWPMNGDMTRKGQ